MSTVRLPCKLPLAVAPQYAREIELLARAVRDQTVELYQEFLSSGGRAPLDPAHWKREKQRETSTVYVSRERSPPPTAFHRGVAAIEASPEVLSAGDWVPQLRLRLVGTMLGTVDDAMLGATAPSQLAMLMRSAALGDEFVDHRDLLAIRLPTAAAPFTYTGLKWSLRKTSIASLVKARDVTHVEATGFTQVVRPDGTAERVGFLVYHSVLLSQLPALDAQSVVRSKISTCHLFRQASPGVVEIFSTMAMCPGGGMPSKVATLQATDALFAVTRVTESAGKKKLVWMQASRAQGAPKGLAECFPARPNRQETEPQDRTTCTHCARALSALRSVTTCEICEMSVCSRCVTSQKLVFGLGNSDVRVKSLAVCSSCTAMTQRVDNGAALAVFEFVQPAERTRAASKSARTRLGSYASTAISSDGRSSSATFTDSLGRSRVHAAPRDARLDRVSSASSSTTTSADYQQQYTDSLGRSRVHTASREARLDRASSASSSTASIDYQQPYQQQQYTAPAEQYQQRLWQQMNDLCLQAETTYQTTKQHSGRGYSDREETRFTDSYRR